MWFQGPSLRDAKYFAFTGSRTFVYSMETPLVGLDAEVLLHFRTCYSHQITNPRLRGVPHGYELAYIFDGDMTQKGAPQLTQPRDLVLRDIMGKLWTNFIMTGCVERRRRLQRSHTRLRRHQSRLQVDRNWPQQRLPVYHRNTKDGAGCVQMIRNFVSGLLPSLCVLGLQCDGHRRFHPSILLTIFVINTCQRWLSLGAPIAKELKGFRVSPQVSVHPDGR